MSEYTGELRGAQFSEADLTGARRPAGASVGPPH